MDAAQRGRDERPRCPIPFDPLSTRVATWNVGPARGPLLFRLQGDWMVEISPTARFKRISQYLEAILQYLETQEVRGLDVDYRLRLADAGLHSYLESLGVRHLFRLRLSGSGKVHFTMPGTGGVVDQRGSELPVWLGEFLCDPSRADVIRKLRRSAAKTSEVFVIADFGGVPWAVESYLTGELEYVPSAPPDLPHPIGGAWVVHVLGQNGLYWNGINWKAVAARGEGIAGLPPNTPVQADGQADPAKPKHEV